MSSYKKRNKKKKFTRKQIIMIVVAIIVFAFLSALVARALTRNVEENTLSMSSEEIQKLVEDLGCEYISDSDSTEEGYSKEIYLVFDTDTVVDGKTQKARYTNIFRGLVVGTGYKSLILIDSSRDLTIKIKCKNYGIESILINDQDQYDYFSSLVEKEAKKNPLEIELVSMTVNSGELQNLMNNAWQTANVAFGTKESTFNKYDIYFDEGIEVRTVEKKLYNIVFTSKYKGEVVGGIKVGASLDAIKDRFGTSYESGGIYGYKTKDFYVYFSSNQISIYPNYNYTELTYKDFEDIVKQFSKDKNINDFMDKLTDIWPDYDLYNYDTTFLEIDYTLKGVRIAYSTEGNDGIQLYENYSGSLADSKESLEEVHYIIDENLIIKNELNRIVKESVIPDDYDNETLKVSNIFVVTGNMVDDSRMNNITILCKNGQYPHATLDDTIIMSKYVWADDTHLIYNIQGQGIYLYNAATRQTKTILSGKDETYNLTDYDRESKVLTYDGKKVVIKY